MQKFNLLKHRKFKTGVKSFKLKFFYNSVVVLSLLMLSCTIIISFVNNILFMHEQKYVYEYEILKIAEI